MRNDGGGLWGYLWAALTAFFTALSVQDISIMFGALVTAALGVATFISNDKRNKRMATASEIEAQAAAERTRLLAQYYTRYGDTADHPDDKPVVKQPGGLDELQEAD